MDARAGVLCRALSDQDSHVRKTAVVALARLLSRDYLKWRPELVHRFFATLVCQRRLALSWVR